MKLIFLDIDGVLNHLEHHERSSLHTGMSFCPQAVKELKTIIEKCDAKLVLSSTWRKNQSIKTLQKQLFSHYGLEKYLIGKTPVLNDEIRGKEIELFLQRFRKPVECFIIIDDDNDMGELTNRLVRTSPFNRGLTQEKRDEAIQLLLNKEINASPDSYNEEYHSIFIKKINEQKKGMVAS